MATITLVKLSSCRNYRPLQCIVVHELIAILFILKHAQINTDKVGVRSKKTNPFYSNIRIT